MRDHDSVDPRSPLVFDTHDLARQPGNMRTLTETVPAPEDLGTPVIGFPPGTDLELDVRLESVMEGVLVSGFVRGDAQGECVRCLGSMTLPVEVSVSELYAYPERQQAATEAGDEDEDIRLLEGELLDFEEALRDAVVSALPYRPLCTEDCPGLCSECGFRLAEDPDHVHDVLDPRWAALQSMLDTTKES